MERGEGGDARMKPRHAAALALLAGWYLSACTIIPHRELSPRVTGTVLDDMSRRLVSGATVTMDGFFNGTATSGENGQFEIARRQEWMSYVPIGDPGCDVTIRAAGYRPWHTMFLCGLPEYPYERGMILLSRAD
jgi:hypothetical protein